MDDGRIISVVNRPTEEGGWVATHEDITERKRAERELDHTRAFLDMIVENVPSPIIVKDAADLKYLLVNRATEKYFGVDRANIVGKTTAEFLPKDIADTILVEDMKTDRSRRNYPSGRTRRRHAGKRHAHRHRDAAAGQRRRRQAAISHHRH